MTKTPRILNLVVFLLLLTACDSNGYKQIQIGQKTFRVPFENLREGPFSRALESSKTGFNFMIPTSTTGEAAPPTWVTVTSVKKPCEGSAAAYNSCRELRDEIDILSTSGQATFGRELIQEGDPSRWHQTIYIPNRGDVRIADCYWKNERRDVSCGSVVKYEGLTLGILFKEMSPRDLAALYTTIFDSLELWSYEEEQPIN